MLSGIQQSIKLLPAVQHALNLTDLNEDDGFASTACKLASVASLFFLSLASIILVPGPGMFLAIIFGVTAYFIYKGICTCSDLSQISSFFNGPPSNPPSPPRTLYERVQYYNPPSPLLTPYPNYPIIQTPPPAHHRVGGNNPYQQEQTYPPFPPQYPPPYGPLQHHHVGGNSPPIQQNPLPPLPHHIGQSPIAFTPPPLPSHRQHHRIGNNNS